MKPMHRLGPDLDVLCKRYAGRLVLLSLWRAEEKQIYLDD